MPSFKTSLSSCLQPLQQPLAALATYEGAKVSEQVASQTRNLPLCQGTTEIPSGRFPSERRTLAGSNLDGICAVVRALCTMSFSSIDDDLHFFFNSAHECPIYPPPSHSDNKSEDDRAGCPNVDPQQLSLFRRPSSGRGH